MKRMTGLLVFCLSSWLAIPAHAGKAAGGKTPEEAFDHLVTAAKSGDMKDFLSHLSKDSQKVLTGSVLVGVVAMREYADLFKKAGKEFDIKPITALLDKHKVDTASVAATLKKLEGAGKGDPKSAVTLVMRLADELKEPAGFFADAVDVMRVVAKDRGPAEKLKDAKLKEVKADGERARGTIENAGRTENIHFVREAGAWKVDILPMILEKAKKE